VLEYGQTGSGKTHTVFGEGGAVHRAVWDFIDAADATLSFYEIYQNRLVDLSTPSRTVLNPCEGADGRVSILGLESVAVDGPQAAWTHIQQCLAQRQCGATAANATSSRSHAVLQLRRGDAVLTFVDLAGSERGADRATADRRTRLEGSEINKSLLALKECIRALDGAAPHLPFRQSKLTMVLKDAIVGATAVRTVMIATVSPSSSCFEHTLNTLRYAERFLDISGGAGTLSVAEPSAGSSPVGSLPPLPGVSARPAVKPAAAPQTGTLSKQRGSVARERVSMAIDELQRLAASRDTDILELLAEELSSLVTAFRSLS
jgi:kinesin family member 2/24